MNVSYVLSTGLNIFCVLITLILSHFFEAGNIITMGFPGGMVVKNLHANAGDIGEAELVPNLGRSPRGGNGNPLQYSCLENPMDRGAWWATVHGDAKSWKHLRTQIHYYYFHCKCKGA